MWLRVLWNKTLHCTYYAFWLSRVWFFSSPSSHPYLLLKHCYLLTASYICSWTQPSPSMYIMTMIIFQIYFKNLLFYDQFCHLFAVSSPLLLPYFSSVMIQLLRVLWRNNKMNSMSSADWEHSVEIQHCAFFQPTRGEPCFFSFLNLDVDILLVQVKEKSLWLEEIVVSYFIVTVYVSF